MLFANLFFKMTNFICKLRGVWMLLINSTQKYKITLIKLKKNIISHYLTNFRYIVAIAYLKGLLFINNFF